MIKTNYSAMLHKDGYVGLSIMGASGQWFSRRIWLDSEEADANMYIRLDGVFYKVDDLRADGWDVQLPEV